MDPITGIILIGILVMAGAKTAASGATDFVAQKKGNTPPSLEKWRKREERRRLRGERPAKEPGPWRRRWNNALELSTEKAAQKHAARLEHLRDTGRGNVDRHKDKLRRRAERQERIGSALAGFAESSWQSTKDAAGAVKDVRDDRRAEKEAWRENARRDAETGEQPDATGDNERADGATVLSFNARPGNDGYPGEQNAAAVTGKDSPDKSAQLANLDGHPVVTDNEGTTTMSAPTHSGEITDLPSAIAYVQASGQYCDSINGTFEDAQAQAASTAADLERQLAALENAQSTLAGEGFDHAVTGHFAAVAEHFNTLITNMRQVNELLGTTGESINAAKSELDASGRVFQAQMGIAEEVASHQSVASNTRFYANA